MLPCVVVIKNGVVDELIISSKDEVENLFVEKCRENITNFDDYTNEDIEDVISDGYETFGTACSVCLSWGENKNGILKPPT